MNPQALRPFGVAYASTAISGLFYIYLIQKMPQGFHFDFQMTLALMLGFLLTIGGIYLFYTGRCRLSFAIFAIANIYSIRPFCELAHLAPSYIGRGYRLADATLSTIDGMTGFDWQTYFAWHAAHPLFGTACRVAYMAWPMIALSIVLILAWSNESARICKLLIATNISLIVVYLLAIPVPSYGAYAFYGIHPTDHASLHVQFSNYKPVYDALRAGSVDIYAHSIPSGAISFPSFHTTTVVLYCWAILPSRWKWIIVPIQALSVLAIPVQGAHFLTDMVVGGVIGWVGILVANVAVSRSAAWIEFMVPSKDQGDAKQDFLPVSKHANWL